MKPQIKRWAVLKSYVAVTRSPLYGIHIQVGRWMVGRETQEFHNSTKQARKHLPKGGDK